MVYIIKVMTVSGRWWILERRYKDFLLLHSLLMLGREGGREKAEEQQRRGEEGQKDEMGCWGKREEEEKQGFFTLSFLRRKFLIYQQRQEQHQQQQQQEEEDEEEEEEEEEEQQQQQQQQTVPPSLAPSLLPSFPRKRLVGNFLTYTITRRQKQFQTYLQAWVEGGEAGEGGREGGWELLRMFLETGRYFDLTPAAGGGRGGGGEGGGGGGGGGEGGGKRAFSKWMKPLFPLHFLPSFLPPFSNSPPPSWLHPSLHLRPQFPTLPASLPPPVCLQDFELLRVIGQGSFGRVFLVRHTRHHGGVIRLSSSTSAAVVDASSSSPFPPSLSSSSAPAASSFSFSSLSISSSRKKMEEEDEEGREDIKQIYAMKVVRKTKQHREERGRKGGKAPPHSLHPPPPSSHAITERHFLTQLSHPFILSLHFAFQTPEKLYLITEYCQGGELFFHLRKHRTFSLEVTTFYASELCAVLSYLNKKNIIFRDLKPENILMDKRGHVKLVDFGLAKGGMEGGRLTKTFCGTPEYLAPEMVLNRRYVPSLPPFLPPSLSPSFILF